MKQRALAMMAVMFVAGGCSGKATPEERAEIQRRLDEVLAITRKDDEERRAKLLALIAKGPPPGESAARCAANVGSGVFYAHERATPATAGHQRGPRLEQVEKEAERVMFLADQDDPWEGNTPKDMLRYAPTLGTYWETELTIVVDEERAPGAPQLDIDARSRSPSPFGGAPLGSMAKGAIVGRAYLYDVKRREYVCAGSFIATSSDSIEVDAMLDLPGTVEQRAQTANAAAAERASYDLKRASVDAAVGALRALVM